MSLLEAGIIALLIIGSALVTHKLIDNLRAEILELRGVVIKQRDEIQKITEMIPG